MTNLATETDEDRTTLSSITSDLATANAYIASLKRKPKIQSNPADRDKNRSNHGNY